MVRLIAIDAYVDSALESADVFARRYGAEVSAHVEPARDVVRQTLDLYARVNPVPPWVGYLTVDAGRKVVVGGCAFTSSPSGEGEVEIAYFTFPEYERQGFATAMARQLVEIARTSGQVRHVIANTLPTPNASTRVLEKCGFQRIGEGFDPDVGRTWQWRLEL